MHYPTSCRFIPLWVIVLHGLALAQNRGTDDSEIRDLVKQYVAAREKGDAQAISALFTQDADQLVSSGEWRKGREGVVAGTVASSVKEKGQTRTIELQSIRFIAPDVAIADGHYVLSGGASGSRNMWTTILAKRTPAGWRITAIRNMLPAPPR